LLPLGHELLLHLAAKQLFGRELFNESPLQSKRGRV
jgi:hypothetical protein